MENIKIKQLDYVQNYQITHGRLFQVSLQA